MLMLSLPPGWPTARRMGLHSAAPDQPSPIGRPPMVCLRSGDSLTATRARCGRRNKSRKVQFPDGFRPWGVDSQRR